MLQLLQTLHKNKCFCTRVSAADAFNVQQVSKWEMVSMGVSKLTWHSSMLDQWHILPQHVSDSKAAACNAWDLCHILYHPTMQCSCCCYWAWETVNLLEQQIPVLLSFHHISGTQQHRFEPAWLQKMGRNAASGLSSSWLWWTKAVLDQCLAWFWAQSSMSRW